MFEYIAKCFLKRKLKDILDIINISIKPLYLKSKIHSNSEVVSVMEKNQAGKRVGDPGGR